MRTPTIDFIHGLIQMAYDEQWITVNAGSKEGGEGGGSHVLIGENGEIKAGMGGKFKGEKISEIHKGFTGAKTPKGLPKEAIKAAPKMEAGKTTKLPKGFTTFKENLEAEESPKGGYNLTYPGMQMPFRADADELVFENGKIVGVKKDLADFLGLSKVSKAQLERGETGVKASDLKRGHMAVEGGKINATKHKILDDAYLVNIKGENKIVSVDELTLKGGQVIGANPDLIRDMGLKPTGAVGTKLTAAESRLEKEGFFNDTNDYDSQLVAKTLAVKPIGVNGKDTLSFQNDLAKEFGADKLEVGGSNVSSEMGGGRGARVDAYYQVNDNKIVLSNETMEGVNSTFDKIKSNIAAGKADTIDLSNEAKTPIHEMFHAKRASVTPALKERGNKGRAEGGLDEALTEILAGKYAGEIYKKSTGYGGDIISKPQSYKFQRMYVDDFFKSFGSTVDANIGAISKAYFSGKTKNGLRDVFTSIAMKNGMSESNAKKEYNKLLEYTKL